MTVCVSVSFFSLMPIFPMIIHKSNFYLTSRMPIHSVNEFYCCDVEINVSKILRVLLK